MKIYHLNEISSSPTSILLTLTKITLVDSALVGSALCPAFMGVLGSLPKLRILKVIGRSATEYEFVSNVINCDERSFQQLKCLKWRVCTLLNGNWGKVQCQTFNVWSSKGPFVCSRTNYGAWVPCGMWKFYIPIQNWHGGTVADEDGCKLHVYPNNWEKVDWLCHALVRGWILRGQWSFALSFIRVLMVWYDITRTCYPFFIYFIVF